MHEKKSEKYHRDHPIPTGEMWFKLSRFNVAKLHRSDKRLSRSIARLICLCFQIPMLLINTYQRVAEVVVLEAFGHHVEKSL